MRNKLILFTIFLCSTTHALSPEAQKAVDTYLLQRAGASKVCAAMIAGIDDKAKNYISEGEKAVRDDIPIIEEANREAMAAIQGLDEGIRVGQTTNWDIYTDPEFVRAMRGEVINYCCAMPGKAGLARKGLVYQKLQHSGGGDASSYQNNSVNPNGGGGGGGGGHGGGGHHGGGHRRGGG